MNPINIKIISNYFGDIEELNLYLQTLTNDPYVKLNIHEFDTLKSFVKKMEKVSAEYNKYDGCYLGYKMDHIGHEFDLLKISKEMDKCINIEFKSQQTSYEEILKQLELNRKYLKPKFVNNIVQYTFIKDSDIVYKLSEDKIFKTDIYDLAKEFFSSFAFYNNNDLDDFSQPKQFSISPINNIDKSIVHGCYLTSNKMNLKTLFSVRLFKINTMF